jgi:hippurate hydrolase
LVAQLLRSWGYSVQEGLAGTGVVGTMTFGPDGRTVLLRADMDALPIQENSNRAHASVHKQVMHACGHDGHVAALLGAASHLSKVRPNEGTLHVLFQPAEEATDSGAARLIKNGELDHLKVDAVYAFHTWPDLPRGKAAVHPATVMAAADFFTIEINGQAAHAGMPHLSRDSITATAQLITALQTIVSREADPGNASVISIGTMRAGQVGTQIADQAFLEGTIRALTDPALQIIREALHRVVAGVCSGLGVIGEVRFNGAVPATVNTPRCFTLAKRALAEILGADNVIDNLAPSMAAEDFSILLKKWPGCFFWLGGGTGKLGELIPLHDSRFDFDDATLVVAAQTFARIVHFELCPVEISIDAVEVDE